MEKADPRIAAYDAKTGKLDGVDYAHITALDTAAIQEQQQEIAALTQRLIAAEQEISELKAAHSPTP